MFTKIVGVTHSNSDGTSRQKILKKMRREEREYERVELEHEPDNPYDENAIKVLNSDGEQLGYLNSRLAEDILKRVMNGETFSAVITEFTGGENGKSTVGCNLKITSHYRTDLSDKGLWRALAVGAVITLIVVLIVMSSR